MYFLVGDIGGTNCRLALYENENQIAQMHYQSHFDSNLTHDIKDFLQSIQQSQTPKQTQIKIDQCCLAVAGPIENQSAHLTNLGWTLDAKSLSRDLGFDVHLINDFYAQALAVSILKPHQRLHLAGPQDLNHTQPWAILGMGTGLGEALLIPTNLNDDQADDPHQADVASDWIVVPTEGGHCRFAPKDQLSFEFLCHLQARFGQHISIERLLSGQGIVDLYAFLSKGIQKPAHEITHLALTKSDQTAQKCMDIIISYYGDEAANLSLKSKSKAVFLSGGISPKILPLLMPLFEESFLDKGRYRSLLTQTSIYLVTEENPGILGAWQQARLVYSKKSSSSLKKLS
jgi:glucokinase